MVQLHNADCLEILATLPDKSIDMILTDPPYGTVACSWDQVIPFAELWPELKRVIKPGGAVVLFGQEPFSSALRMSNPDDYKYDLIWKKSLKVGYQNANRRPLRNHELISVFNAARYFPQGLVPYGKKNKRSSHGQYSNPTGANEYTQQYTNYPCTVLEYPNETGYHPTQKPVPLLEYLIRTYSLEGETILDFTTGSGSTGVAAINTGRSFVGIERDEQYYKIALSRMTEAQNKNKLTA